MITRSIIHEKINYASLLLIAFTLPFHILLCSYSIAIFVINQIAEGNLFSKLKNSIQNRMVLLFAGFYILHIIGLFFSDNLKEGLFDLEKKSSLMIFPLLLYSVKINKTYIKHILISFISACLLLSIILLSNAFYLFLKDGLIDHFILDHLTSATGIHRVYVSIYFLFSIYILLYFKLTEQKKIFNSNIPINLLLIHFTILIFLIASRTIVLLTFISFIIVTIYSIIRTKQLLKGISGLIIFITLSVSFLSLNEKIKVIMIQTFQDLDKGNTELNPTGPNQRIEIWKASLKAIQENPMGVGSGDVEDILLEKYKENKFMWGIEYKYNAHNQFLQTFIGLGIIGLIFLIAGFIIPILDSFRKKQYLYSGLLLVFALACMSESMLCAQKGVVFYAFFNSLLVFHYPDKNL